MKKGDIIERRKSLPKGSILIRGCKDESQAEEFMLMIDKHYNFHELPRMSHQILPIDGLCVVTDEDTSLTIRAKINWVVEDEVAIEYLDTGGMTIFNKKDELGWIITYESTPVYQDSVEHMTDEQLRDSIELLRARRLTTPVLKTRVKSTTVKKVESAEDKALASVLGGMSNEDKIELQRKLGLID